MRARWLRGGSCRAGGSTRRALLAGFCLTAVGRTGDARGQAAAGVRRVGVLMSLARDDAEAQGWLGEFRQGLEELGWRDGANLAIDIRWAAGNPDSMREHAAALARASPDVVLTNGTPASRAMQASGRAPMVFVSVADPVRTGLVTSLARPGGQVTGFTNFEHAAGAKWLELLAEVAPGLSRVVILANPANDATAGFVQSIEAAAKGRQLALTTAPATNADDIERAIRAASASPGAGLIVLPDFATSLHHDVIARLALERRLPAVHPFRFFVASGGLLAYSVDMRDVYRRAATYADRILRGAMPGDLPVQQPTTFHLAVNVRTAQALGLTIPPTLLARADEVIE